MQTLWQDLRYGARLLHKNSGLTFVVIVMPALQRKSFIPLRLLLVATLALGFTVVRGQEPALNLNLAEQYFREAQTICQRDQGRLWGVSLCGPMLFADVATRAVVGNQADKEGRLHSAGAVFTATLPPAVAIANTALEWAGVKWTMVMWPLPEEKQERIRLMAHELFHRVQESRKLAATDAINAHLDQKDGRIWLRLEWRALERALQEQGAARKVAATDALVFRRFRQSLFPQSAAREFALETNEGLAEYTGLKLSTRSLGELAALAAYALRQFHRRPSYTRSFAYATGPAYGILLDAAGDNWRQRIKTGDDLSALLQKALTLKLPADLAAQAMLRAARYDGEEVIAFENARETTRRQQVEKYRALLVDGPVLALPIGGSFNYSYNPNNLVSLDDSTTVYPTARVTDDWGVLEVSGGVLMLRASGRITRLQVAAPAAADARPLQGNGWKLELKEGWELVRGERAGDFVLRKRQ
jgi:hypothetical protein